MFLGQGLNLFGAPTVASGDGTSLALPFERRTQVVVLLALRRDWVPRAELAAMLWPEQPAKQAFANLRKTLFRLPLLAWAPAVQADGAALRLTIATDVEAFDQALRDRRSADALAAYRGELLAGFDDGQSEAWTRWVGFERDRLRAAWRGAALETLENPALDATQAVALSARLLDSDPLDEAALRLHLGALARDGQAGAAHHAYAAFAERLAAELGVEPGAELRALNEALGDAPGRTPRRMPEAAAAGFVGRSVELRRIGDLLARDECRLLCLIGPGGVGKTRLARQTLAEAAARQEATAFVALEDVESAEQFGLRLAQAAGVSGGSGDAMSRVLAAWGEGRRLLVLDNFEQLAPHAPLLDGLLEACPRLKILVTSRVRLTVAGEWSMPIEGLPFPDPEDDDRAESFDAVRLFVQAAQRVEPAFAVGAERPAIVDICRQVEGLPLAIELAATWVRVLSCSDIAAELRSGAELLRAEDSRHPPRHASIDAVFEHSWRRLGSAERAALAKLSVFRGGFSIEAARAVAGATLPVLGALADTSLLTNDGQRMRLHPLVQQLATVRLDEQGERETAAAAHAAHFHRWLHKLHGAARNGQREALQAIDAEFDNCRRAWQFSVDAGQAGALLRSVPTLLQYFEHRARFEDGLAMLRQAIDAPPPAGDDGGLRALLTSLAARMEMRMARYADAEATARVALAAAEGARDREARFHACSVLAGCALAVGRADEATLAFDEALALARAGARPQEIAGTLDNLALCAKRQGRYEDALQLSLEALAQHRRHGDQARMALCLNNLGSMSLFMDDVEAAEAHLREALQTSERHGLVSTRAFVLANLTELALKTGDDAAARRAAERALELAEAGGIRPLTGWLKVQLARLAARRGELALARTLLAGAADLAGTTGLLSVKPAVLLGLAELLEVQGHAVAARRLLAFAADEASLSAPDRDELRAAWARRISPDSADPPWPGWTLAELLHRVVIEADSGHAALIAGLKL
jgi:predicted ATPase/DNA-binding SARP family transcriptional activator